MSASDAPESSSACCSPSRTGKSTESGEEHYHPSVTSSFVDSLSASDAHLENARRISEVSQRPQGYRLKLGEGDWRAWHGLGW